MPYETLQVMNSSCCDENAQTIQAEHQNDCIGLSKKEDLSFKSNMSVTEEPATYVDISKVKIESNTEELLPDESYDTIKKDQEVNPGLIKEEVDETYYDEYSRDNGHHVFIVNDTIPERDEIFTDVNLDLKIPRKVKKPLCCEFCNYETLRQNNLTVHLRNVHEKVIKMDKTFDKSDYKVVNQVKLDKICENDDKEMKNFLCSLCDYKGALEWHLLKHIKACHKGVKPFACNVCNYKADRKIQVVNHIKVVHERIEYFSCDLCDYKTAQRSHLKRHHQSMHEKVKEKIYLCGMCEYRSALKGELLKHVQYIHNEMKPLKRFFCQTCDYKASDKSTLEVHLRSVHEGVKPFSCSYCEYKASRRGHLNNHIRSVHEMAKPFSCSLCDYKSSQKGHLGRHIKSVHEGMKPFPCGFCDYKASQKNHLDKHIKTIHKDLLISSSFGLDCLASPGQD